MKPHSYPPPIWPAKQRAQGVRAVLRGTARYLQARGWWPTQIELHVYLRADKYAVWFYIGEAETLGLMTREPRMRGQVQITARGWQALAYEPIMPWRPRPSLRLRDKITVQVVKEVLAELKA